MLEALSMDLQASLSMILAQHGNLMVRQRPSICSHVACIQGLLCQTRQT